MKAACIIYFVYLFIGPGQDIKMYPRAVRLNNQKVPSYTRSLDQIFLETFLIFNKQ